MIMKKLSPKEIEVRSHLLKELQGKLTGWHKDSVGKQFGALKAPAKMAEGGTVQDRSNSEMDAKTHNEAVESDNAGDNDDLVKMPKDGLVRDEGDHDDDGSDGAYADDEAGPDESSDEPAEKSKGMKLEDLISNLSKGK